MNYHHLFVLSLTLMACTTPAPVDASTDVHADMASTSDSGDAATMPVADVYLDAGGDTVSEAAMSETTVDGSDGDARMAQDGGVDTRTDVTTGG